MDTEIRVSTESWPWRRKFSCSLSRDSNLWPFNHKSGALTTCCSLVWWAVSQGACLFFGEKTFCWSCLIPLSLGTACKGGNPAASLLRTWAPSDWKSATPLTTSSAPTTTRICAHSCCLLLTWRCLLFLLFFVCSYSNCNSEGNFILLLMVSVPHLKLFLCVLCVGWVSVMWYWLIVVDSSQPYSDLLVDSEHRYVLHYKDVLIELENACASFRTIMFGYNDLKQEWLLAF